MHMPCVISIRCSALSTAEHRQLVYSNTIITKTNNSRIADRCLFLLDVVIASRRRVECVWKTGCLQTHSDPIRRRHNVLIHPKTQAAASLTSVSSETEVRMAFDSVFVFYRYRDKQRVGKRQKETCVACLDLWR